VVFNILFLKTITNEVRESESEGSVLGTVLKFVESTLSQVTRLFGRVVPLPEEKVERVMRFCVEFLSS
jgi:hypothetical protein